MGFETKIAKGGLAVMAPPCSRPRTDLAQDSVEAAMAPIRFVAVLAKGDPAKPALNYFGNVHRGQASGAG